MKPKLTKEQVRAIAWSEKSNRALAAEHGVTEWYVSRIKNGRVRPDLTGKSPTVRESGVDLARALAMMDVDGCLPWPKSPDGNYPGRVSLDGEMVRAHRAVCMFAHGDPPPGYQAAHSCGNPICVNPNHLRWATPSENSFDRDDHGTMPHGNKHWNRKLSESQVLDIARSGEPVKQIMERLGVGARTVYDIRQGRTWSRVTGIVY